MPGSMLPGSNASFPIPVGNLKHDVYCKDDCKDDDDDDAIMMMTIPVNWWVVVLSAELLVHSSSAGDMHLKSSVRK